MDFVMVTCSHCREKKAVLPFYGTSKFKCEHCKQVFWDTVDMGLFVVQDEKPFTGLLDIQDEKMFRSRKR